jgi:hypothetical protein
MSEDQAQAPPAIRQIEAHTSLNLIPVGIKEAALDSPTFRATALHFADNIDAVEKWLTGYIAAASRLVVEVASLETAVNSFLSQSTPPAHISEAVLDHDYTMLAMMRYGEGAREFWSSTLRGIKRYDGAVIDPIKSFLSNDLRIFKEARRALDSAQKNFDSVVTRYSSQGKGKESSSLREDAFQLHEARKLYLRTSMDFCVQAPVLRASLDKVLVRIFTDQWKEMRQAREANTTLFSKWNFEMERVRGWSREMENSERAFKRELLLARKQIEDSAELKQRPSRELEDYAVSTVPYLGTGASSATGANRIGEERAEKQGWLFLKTITGKPARTIWSRRWYFVKNGIFGWLIQGIRSGGVEESERTGVLLCSVRPAFQEERRFCFEVKTKDQSVILQAETQQELTEWISAFEVAKRKALEDPASTEASSSTPGIDPAFAISPPSSSEFAAKMGDGHIAQGSEDGITSLEREATNLGVNTIERRVTSLERDPDTGLREGTREHAARIIQKLDLHKRSTASPQLTQQGAPPGGIASLISASHNILPVASNAPGSTTQDTPRRVFSMPTSTLAPSTLANPPAATNLSHTAVVVSGEKGISLGRADGSGMPSGILANLWGSSNWGYVNRLGDEPQPSSPTFRPRIISQDDSILMDGMREPMQPEPSHRRNLSASSELDVTRVNPLPKEEYPSYYPLPLKAQHAQFRMLFPSVPKADKVVLVFRATWNPNDQQEFPGRVYVTERNIYFFSNHLGLVLVTGVSLSSLEEVTAAPGRDCDFLYLHFKEGTQDARRVTIKVFLEPLKLLQRRLSYLVRNANDEHPGSMEEVVKKLMEMDERRRSSSAESWEDLSYDAEEDHTPHRRRERNLKASLRIDGNLYGETAKTGREIQKFKLPAQAVVYAPQGMQLSVSRDFTVSAKALFHVMFGDKSAVFQLLYANRWDDKIIQTPWTKSEGGHWTRNFKSQSYDSQFTDKQTVDIYNDHLCYVVTNDKYPWRLPYSDSLMLLTKFVITHTAKSRCKLAVYERIVWHKAPPLKYLQRLVERQAHNSLEADALDLSNVAMDQVGKLGSHSKTNKALEVFGTVGQQKQAAQVDSSQVPSDVLPAITPIQTRPVNIIQLVANDILARTLSALSLFFDVAVAIGKGALALCQGHTLLVVVLVISAVYNTWYGYRDGLVWYQERRAMRFMAHMGVSPNPTVNRAIYLSDIDDFITLNDTFSALESTSSRMKTCRTTFQHQLAVADASNPQLHRSRDSLARYRNDLIVALRVVNRVEKDVVLAEWEAWVRSEDEKCERVRGMLENMRNKNDQKGENELGDDFAEYCNSCREEVSGMASGNRLM